MGEKVLNIKFNEDKCKQISYLFFLIFVDYTDLDSLLIFSAVLICCLESGLRIYNVEPLRELRRIGKRPLKHFNPSQITLSNALGAPRELIIPSAHLMHCAFTSAGFLHSQLQVSLL